MRDGVLALEGDRVSVAGEAQPGDRGVLRHVVPELHLDSIVAADPDRLGLAADGHGERVRPVAWRRDAGQPLTAGEVVVERGVVVVDAQPDVTELPLRLALAVRALDGD